MWTKDGAVVPLMYYYSGKTRPVSSKLNKVAREKCTNKLQVCKYVLNTESKLKILKRLTLGKKNFLLFVLDAYKRWRFSSICA